MRVCVQISFHMPSEHAVSGRQFPLEIQFWHTTAEVAADVQPLDVALAVFVEETGDGYHGGRVSPLPTHLFSNLHHVGTGAGFATALRLNELRMDRYYSYRGSLTVAHSPPPLIRSHLPVPRAHTLTHT